MKHQVFKLIKAFWKIYPFKKSLSKMLNSKPTIKSKLYQDLRFKGAMKINLDDKSFYLYNPGFTTIENEIFWNGLNSWEKTSVSLWQIFTLKAKVILDIGANTGLFSLIAASINKDAKIYAFEPVQRTASLFKKNLALNEFDNIILTEKAVSNTTGSATFYDVSSESQYSASLEETMLQNVTNTVSYDVDVIALDQLNYFQNEKIDLIKMDVEMHEPEALEGMINSIKKDTPIIIIEILNSTIGVAINAIFSQLNYDYYVIDENKGIHKVDTLGDEVNQNFLLYPSSLDSNIISSYIY